MILKCDILKSKRREKKKLIKNTIMKFDWLKSKSIFPERLSRSSSVSLKDTLRRVGLLNQSSYEEIFNGLPIKSPAKTSTRERNLNVVINFRWLMIGEGQLLHARKFCTTLWNPRRLKWRSETDMFQSWLIALAFMLWPPQALSPIKYLIKNTAKIHKHSHKNETRKINNSWGL